LAASIKLVFRPAILNCHISTLGIAGFVQALPERWQSTSVINAQDYERAVADYNNCVVEHTANLSACEKQRAIMNSDEKALSRPSPSQSNKIINMER
jgi:hypothetical protein